MAWWDKAGPGAQVTATVVELTVATPTIFTIGGGRVLLTAIVGVIGEGAVGGACNVFLRLDPTAIVGTATITALCAARNIVGYPVGDLLTITGVPGDPMVPVAAAGAVPSMTMPVVLTQGDLEFCIDAAVVGNVIWTAWYKPLDPAGYILAA